MFFGGGLPFGFAHHPSQQDDEQNQEQSLYDLLGLTEDASQQQIKEKHKELAQKFKPGGQSQDPEHFQQINEAFQILSNPQQRKLYDQQQQQQKKLFQMMHGGHSSKNKSNELPKMQPTKRGISVPLQKLYSGGTMPLYHQRARKCQTCQGKGGKDVKSCTTCKGKGAVAKMVQVGPGMFTQMAENCKECEGKGDIFGEGGKCQTCEGKRIVKKSVDLQVPIPAGAPPGHVITLQGDGNEVHNARAGDLYLVIQEQHNEHFTRKGADLFYKKSISLVESLLGFNFTLKHLDGKQYIIYTKQGEIVGDSDKKIVKNMGMPFFEAESESGNLIIEFKVVMPKRGQLSADQIAALTSILPGKINERPKDTNYQMLQEYEREHINSNEEGGRKEDDEQEGQQGGIGCQAQ